VVGVCVVVGVTVLVGVCVVVGVGVDVAVGVTVVVGVGVTDGVGVGDDLINSKSKSQTSTTSVQLTHQKSNKLNGFFRSLKLC